MSHKASYAGVAFCDLLPQLSLRGTLAILKRMKTSLDDLKRLIFNYSTS